jgi:hypothetical protein
MTLVARVVKGDNNGGFLCGLTFELTGPRRQVL